MLADKSYVPLLRVKIAEIEAFRQLSAESKDRTFPVFLLRPWPNANRLSLPIDRIREATGGRPFGLGLDDERYKASSKKEAQIEFDNLFYPSLGFREYFNFLKDIKEAVPVLRPIQDANILLQQLGNAEDLDRGMIVHQQRGSTLPISDTVMMLPPLPHDTIFVVDAGWSRDLLGMQAWCVPVVNRITTALPDAEIVVMSSSFPDSFGHIVGNNEEPAHETHVFNAVRQQFQSANLTLGDWGSTRLPQSGGGGKIPSRIDIALPASWHIFRADPLADLGFSSIAEEAMNHPCFSSAPECWGKLQISSTDGSGTGITGTKMNTSARINMHLTIKAGASSTLDLHEEPYHD